MSPRSLLTVCYTGEPDEVHELSEDGQELLFGRDDEACDLVIWSAINSHALSRIAGRIWRMEGQLWLRNLSTTHELTLAGEEGPPEAPLPPRRDDGLDPGPARSIPAGRVLVHAPDGCELLVHQHRAGFVEVPLAELDEMTVRVPPVPDRLRQVAAALCAPLLAGGQLPASYAEVGRTTGIESLKRVRLLVGELCELYLAEAPLLRARLEERRRVDAQTQVLPPARLRSGVWSFEGRPGGGPEEAERAEQAERAERARRRSLSLPDYFEVAHLLVRRRLVTGDDAPGSPG